MGAFVNEVTRTTLRDPLCEEALRTNRELRLRVDELERREKRRGSVRAKLAAAEIELRERDASPWVFLPWRGYVS